MGGRIIYEWEMDWLDLPKRGRQAIRLYCPNGQVAELGTTVDATGRIFQLKTAVAAVGKGSRTTSHLIGLVDGLNGECQCAAWDYGTRRLLTFRDNVNQMRYAQIGAIAVEHVGLTQ